MVNFPKVNQEEKLCTEAVNIGQASDRIGDRI